MLRVFIGYDPRVAVQYHVLVHSLLEHTSIPLEIIPLKLDTLPLKRRGLTEFTFSRFLVPWICDFKGVALFLDSDILCTGDIAEILKQPMAENHAVGYCNTDPAFERASVMLFNCAHPDNAKLTLEYLETTEDKLHLIQWNKAGCLLPNRFNFLVGYDKPEWTEGKTPTLIHYTKGVPAWPETTNCDYADLWVKCWERTMYPAVQWGDLMGKSVHAVPGPGGLGQEPRTGPDVTRRHL